MLNQRSDYLENITLILTNLLKRKGKYLTYIKLLLNTTEITEKILRGLIELYYNDPLIRHLGVDKLIKFIIRNHEP